MRALIPDCGTLLQGSWVHSALVSGGSLQFKIDANLGFYLDGFTGHRYIRLIDPLLNRLNRRVNQFFRSRCCPQVRDLSVLSDYCTQNNRYLNVRFKRRLGIFRGHLVDQSSRCYGLLDCLHGFIRPRRSPALTIWFVRDFSRSLIAQLRFLRLLQILKVRWCRTPDIYKIDRKIERCRDHVLAPCARQTFEVRHQSRKRAHPDRKQSLPRSSLLIGPLPL